MITDTSEVAVEWFTGSLGYYHHPGACEHSHARMARSQAALLGVRPYPTCFWDGGQQ